MIWMWEATAAAGQLPALRDWAIHALSGRKGEVYLSHQAAGDLIIVIVRSPWTGSGGGSDQDSIPEDPAEVPMPAPPSGLTAGPPRAWPFEQIHPVVDGGPPAAGARGSTREEPPNR
ncbi:conserved hypothetical protein [Frankia sp. AiPs1]|uniref:hypothetical protein n=1 Tax=Frankia sp. AiPa1 TaxID=573492 RepID=UPI00202B8786|nr:hypothetical protein [Frankia sp. AiPa1]MCL9757769.1 hypothetical protein [Frankia sp. AiPa1]